MFLVKTKTPKILFHEVDPPSQVARDRFARLVEIYAMGPTNAGQHAAFQALWVQYDHLVPHARGGGNGLDNIVITCGPCNFGRMERTLEEVGLIDPRTRAPVRSSWDGLERYLGGKG